MKKPRAGAFSFIADDGDFVKASYESGDSNAEKQTGQTYYGLPRWLE